MARDLQVNGINMHIEEEGEGTPVLLLHGFPNSSALWRHQIPSLASAGYRAIAPDLRGFGATERPEGKDAYRLELLMGDLTGLLGALEIERCHVVSHDWGAFLGWGMAMFLPDTVERHVAISVGHPANWQSPSIRQREMSWYLLFFQHEGLAEDALRADDWKLFREWARNHPEVETWIRDLSRPGALTAGLNWYRANANPVDSALATSEFPPVSVPTLGIWSDGEAYCGEEQMKDSERWVKAEWRYERIDGASHFIPVDEPERVTALILEWLSAA